MSEQIDSKICVRSVLLKLDCFLADSSVPVTAISSCFYDTCFIKEVDLVWFKCRNDIEILILSGNLFRSIAF